MQACSDYTQTKHLDYNVEQLRLPLDLSVAVDKYDPLWSFPEVIKEVNLKKYLKPHRGNQGHNSLMMMKTVLFAYMKQVYSRVKMMHTMLFGMPFLRIEEMRGGILNTHLLTGGIMKQHDALEPSDPHMPLTCLIIQEYPGI
jgi:hypothetical protein